MMAFLLRLENVTKRFGPVTAIESLSLEIERGSFFALLGPSGCGKTTLLRIIAGFEIPDHGHVFLEGKEITTLKPNRRPVNLMFQSYALFPHMSVFGNVAYGLEMEGVRGVALKNQVMEMLERVHLADMASRKPHQLSGGQRQRVALARSLIKQPKILLLDEPLGALDRKLREEMQIELKRLQQDTGITFIVVTHDQEEALALADRIALLKEGRIVQIGSPRDLYDRPANRFVADFIGLANFIPGIVSDGNFIIEGLEKIALPNSSFAPGVATLVVRPEAMSLSTSPLSQAIEGRVEGTAFLGQDIIVHIAVKGLPQRLVARLPAHHPLSVELVRGKLVYCSWVKESVSLLYNE